MIKGLALPRLLDTLTITAAGTVTGNPVYIGPDAAFLTFEAIFTYGSGGSTAKAYLQTSLDGGATWIDIGHASFTTATASKLFPINGVGSMPAATAPTDGSLAADTVLDGVLGEFIRTKVVTTGTYAGGTTLLIAAVTKTGAAAKPAALGQAAASASMPVVDATDTWTSPDNSIVSVTNASTALLAAAGVGVRKRKAVLYNMGAQTVSLREGAAPTAGTHFPLVAGATITVETLLAVNGIVASGTCNVAVLSEAAS